MQTHPVAYSCCFQNYSYFDCACVLLNCPLDYVGLQSNLVQVNIPFPLFDYTLKFFVST